MGSRRRGRARQPSRHTPALEPKRRLLVVCEGRRTEPDYIRGFERHVRNATVEIEIPLGCVFDRDDHERFHDAMSMARDNGIELAISNPCVELWLLLHFRESPGARHRREITHMLREHLPRYTKRLNFDDLIGGVSKATTRARRLDDDAVEMGEAGRNPTTGFYLLTDSIARTD